VNRSESQQILSAQRTGRIGQVVGIAQPAHPGGDFRIPIARNIGKQVMLDLVADIAAHERHDRARPEVCAIQHLTQIPEQSPVVSIDTVNLSRR
jgi:hypothetical protein